MIRVPSYIQLTRSFLNESIRMALASKLMLLWFVMSASIFLICLSVRFEKIPSGAGSINQQRVPHEEAERVGNFEIQADGTPSIQGKIQILFGAISLDWPHFREKAGLFMESLLGFFLADWPGLVLALIFTGGLLPEFLNADWWNLIRLHQKSTAMVIVIKTLTIMFLFSSFASGTLFLCWFTLNLTTSTWHPQFLWAIPIIWIQLLAFYPVSAFLAVWTRSTTVAITGAVAFWGLCWLMNHARMTFALPETLTSGNIVEAFYWILPKPIDLSLFLADLTQTLPDKALPDAWKSAWQKEWISPIPSLATSLTFSALVLSATCYEIKDSDK
jgi:hypothetical protein